MIINMPWPAQRPLVTLIYENQCNSRRSARFQTFKSFEILPLSFSTSVLNQAKGKYIGIINNCPELAPVFLEETVVKMEYENLGLCLCAIKDAGNGAVHQPEQLLRDGFDLNLFVFRKSALKKIRREEDYPDATGRLGLLRRLCGGVKNIGIVQEPLAQAVLLKVENENIQLPPIVRKSGRIINKNINVKRHFLSAGDRWQ